MFTKHSAGSRGRSRPAVWAIVWVVCAAVGAAHGMPPRPDPVVAVDCDSGDSINNALRRADPNHIEVVVSGVCHEAVVISRSDVLIRAVGLGAHGIQGMEGAPALELHHVSNVAIQGLFISGGDVGILVTDSNHRISLSDLVVSENLAGGMTLEDASVSGSNLRVEANGQTPATAGVLVDHGSEFNCDGCTIHGNGLSSGPAVWVRAASSANVSNSSIAGFRSFLVAGHSSLTTVDSEIGFGIDTSFAMEIVNDSFAELFNTSLTNGVFASRRSRLGMFGGAHVANGSKTLAEFAAEGSSYIELRELSNTPVQMASAIIRLFDFSTLLVRHNFNPNEVGAIECLSAKADTLVSPGTIVGSTSCP